MSKRVKEWARRARADLQIILGAKCQQCGQTERLHFDCVVPRGDEHHKMSTDQRMTFYRREHLQHANLQLLCEKCHSLKTAQDARYNLPPPIPAAPVLPQTPYSSPISPAGGTARSAGGSDEPNPY